MKVHRKKAPRTEPRPRGSWAGDSRHWLLLGQNLFVFLLRYKVALIKLEGRLGKTVF